MGLIKVTQISRNGKSVSNVDTLIDVKDIVAPLVENGSGNTVIEVVETGESLATAIQSKTVQYIVNENLATVVALSSDLFLGTVITRDGRLPISGASILGFITTKVLGNVIDVSGDSKFIYSEGGIQTGVEYVISEDLDTISPAEVIELGWKTQTTASLTFPGTDSILVSDSNFLLGDQVIAKITSLPDTGGGGNLVFVEYCEDDANGSFFVHISGDSESSYTGRVTFAYKILK